MARVLKIAAWIGVLLVLVAGSAPFWVPPLVDWNGQRGRLAGLLSAAAGVAVTIEGDIEVASLVPQARLSIGGIAARAGAGFGMTAVLGLPLMLPIVLVSTTLGGELLHGVLVADTWHNFAFLGALTLGSGVLGAVLFPYLWRAS